MPYATISDGNFKLGSIRSISLPPIITCPRGTPCSKQCYALQSYRQYPVVLLAWTRNLRRWRENPDRYFRSIIWQIKKRNLKFFRWHSGGDIPSPQYLQGMIEVAKALSSCKFLCFTKRYSWISGIRFPSNLTMVVSAWPGVKLPCTTRPIAFMDDGNEARIKNAISCPGNCQDCGMCWALPGLKKNVVFPLHSGVIASANARRGKKRKAS